MLGLEAMEESDNVSLKPCACGCGELIAPVNRWGYKKIFKHGHGSIATRFKKGSHPSSNTEFKKLDKHPDWNNGTRRNNGYVMIRVEGHPRADKRGHYVYEHDLIMEQQIGRYLKPNEVVHHINEIRDDNRIENLMQQRNTRSNLEDK